ncbi:MAG: hypothetical protein J6Q48_06070 [Bacteroidaceae bacterium]|nr:hypothetical protein [Bacteroidaceae bacterium]
MSEKELQIIKAHLAYGKMTDAVKEAIKSCLIENAGLKIENKQLQKEKRQMFNRCKLMNPDGVLCFFCGFKEECLKGEEHE